MKRVIGFMIALSSAALIIILSIAIVLSCSTTLVYPIILLFISFATFMLGVSIMEDKDKYK